MRWHDERYVRLYTRDTTTWLMLPWEARCVLPLLLRKLDRAGLLELGQHGVAALSVILTIPAEVVIPGVAALVANGVVEISETGTLGMPNFIEAQGCTASDAKRAREYRERSKTTSVEESSSQSVTGESQNVTTSSRVVTGRHASVTPCCAVLNRTVLNQSDPERETPVSPAGDSVVRIRAAARSRRKGSSLEAEFIPDGWQPDPQRIAKFKSETKLNPTPSIQNFIAYCERMKARGDDRGRYVNFDQGLSAWLRIDVAEGKLEPLPRPRKALHTPTEAPSGRQDASLAVQPLADPAANQRALASLLDDFAAKSANGGEK